METKDVLSWGTLVIAVLGAVLGVFNTWRAWSGDRVRMRTRLLIEVPTGRVIGLQVVNLSTFPITLASVGWMRARPAKVEIAMSHAMVGVVPLPVRMDARGMVVVTSDRIPSEISRAHRFFARTACDAVAVTEHGRFARWKGRFMASLAK